VGLIRKSLFVASGGFVSPNSKKQRLAKQQIRLQRQTLKALQQPPVIVTAPAAPPPPEPDEATGLTDLVIERVDPRRRVQTIKIVREATGLSLARARRIVETREVIECENEEEAAGLRAALEGVGAVIELRENTDEPADARPSSAAAELEQLAKLHAQGDLTDEEFAAAKAKVLRS
jgi:large subunit ribosomal protein L7/L12